MCRLILPLETKPIIKSYQWHAYALGILFTNNDFQNYFYSDYITTIRWYDPNLKQYFYDFHTEKQYFYNGPFEIVVKKIKYDNLLSINNIDDDLIDLLIEMLQKKYYITGFCNEFYFPQRFNYNNKYSPHDFFIYGFDLDKKEFLTIGYTDNLTYKPTTISFDLFKKAIYSCKQDNNILFLKIKDDEKFIFDCEKMKKNLSIYLNSENPGNYSDEFTQYGINAWNNFSDITKNCEHLDYKIPNIFLEQRLVMKERLLYMNKYQFINTSNLIEDLDKICISAQIVLHKSIKYNLKKDQAILEDINNYICNTIEKEVKILNQIYNCI